MQLFLLYYVSLLYLLVFYRYWRRWAFRRRGKTGRKSLKRLRQCAPQILFRIDRQHRQCQQFCHGRYQCILYCFCFYYGIHSQHLSAWLLAASSLHFMWNDVISVISSRDFFLFKVLVAYSGFTGAVVEWTRPGTIHRAIDVNIQSHVNILTYKQYVSTC